MKKNVMFLALLFLVSACQNNNLSNSSESSFSSSNESSSPISTIDVASVLNSLSDNYSASYTSVNGRYHIYKTKDYLYDEELGGGQFVLEDDTMYVYTLHGDVVVPKTPYSALRSRFEQAYPSFKVDMSTFTVEDGLYKTNDEATMTSLCQLINMTAYDHGELFIDEDLLNFRFYDQYNKMLISGKLFSINETAFQPLEKYLNDKIAPETESFPNEPLFNVLGDLKDNLTFVGKQVSNNAGISVLLNKNYIAGFKGNGQNITDGYGFVSIDDDLHSFEMANNEVTVDYEIYDEDIIDLTSFSFKKHDFTKFKEIEPNTYISTDYYNVNNLADLLTLDVSNINTVTIKVDETNKQADITFLRNHEALYTGTIFNINNSSIEALDSYLASNTKPSLPTYENSELMEFVKDLDSNFTYVREDLEDSETFYGVVSTKSGRKEYKTPYNNFPSTDYILYDKNAYHYVINEDSIIPRKNNAISKEKYQEYFTFKGINFHYFQPLGGNRYLTTSTRILRQLSKLLSSNPYNLGRAYLTISNNTLYIEIVDEYLATNTSGHLEKINQTTLDFVDNYKENNAKEDEIFKTYNNQKIKDAILKLQETNNFTVAYQDDPEYDLYFTELQYDYYTNETIYYGMYKDGFITGSLSKYVYNFGWVSDEETGTSVFTLSDHPSIYLDTMADMNPFNSLTAELCDSMEPYQDDKYISLDEEICSVFSLALQMGGVIDVVAVILSFTEQNELKIEVVDEIRATYDENNTRHEEYITFATAIIKDVGTTIIPSFATIPTIK